MKVNKKLTLRGIGNPVVDARGSGSAITLSANGITLEGFTAIGSGHGSFFESPEAGIRITSNRNTLTGNNVSSNNDNGISLNSDYLYSSSIDNTIYNNIFNNTNNIKFYDPDINTWNTTRRSGTNIIGGSLLGGNFWAYPNGTGFSQTCRDVNSDGICDQSYILNTKNIDYLPISMNFTNDKMPPKSVSNLKNVSYASAWTAN
ncbi:MAG TPA: NosD domain-containing protein [Candidatus Methanoperedens sp.]|nr:NosD domain-containing protein [Candidatus Methanoperedens sp.]